MIVISLLIICFPRVTVRCLVRGGHGVSFYDLAILERLYDSGVLVLLHGRLFLPPSWRCDGYVVFSWVARSRQYRAVLTEHKTKRSSPVSEDGAWRVE